MADPDRQFVRSNRKIASTGNLQDAYLNHFPLQLHRIVTKAISSGGAMIILEYDSG